jgi:hypothetical protein
MVSKKHTYSHGDKTWAVQDLIEWSEKYPVELRDLSEFQYILSENPADLWGLVSFGCLVGHMRRIRSADLRYPILLDSEGNVIDGYHRILKGYLQGIQKITVKVLGAMPPHKSRKTSKKSVGRKGSVP